MPQVQGRRVCSTAEGPERKRWAADAQQVRRMAVCRRGRRGRRGRAPPGAGRRDSQAPGPHTHTRRAGAGSPAAAGRGPRAGRRGDERMRWQSVASAGVRSAGAAARARAPVLPGRLRAHTCSRSRTGAAPGATRRDAQRECRPWRVGGWPCDPGGQRAVSCSRRAT